MSRQTSFSQQKSEFKQKISSKKSRIFRFFTTTGIIDNEKTKKIHNELKLNKMLINKEIAEYLK